MERDGFETWFAASSARLHHALVATYGPVDGRAAAVDALGYAWEHWDRLRQMANPMGYLYRVGQSAVRRHRNKPIPLDGRSAADVLDLAPSTVQTHLERAMTRLRAELEQTDADAH